MLICALQIAHFCATFEFHTNSGEKGGNFGLGHVLRMEPTAPACKHWHGLQRLEGKRGVYEQRGGELRTILKG